MLNAETLANTRETNDAQNWNDLYHQVQRRWPSVPTEELRTAGGDLTELAKIVDRYTTDDETNVEGELRKLAEQPNVLWESSVQTIHRACGAACEAAAKTRQSMDSSIQRNPSTAATVAIGAGLIVGALASRILTPRPKPGPWERVRPW